MAYLVTNPIQSMDGMIGLAPNPPSSYPYRNFVYQLFENYLIDKNVFALKLQEPWAESSLILGSDDSDVSIKWAPLSSYYFWSTGLKGVKVDGIVISLSVYSAVYSSIDSDIVVPTFEYPTLMERITHNHTTCMQYDQTYMCDCETPFPVIELDLGGDTQLTLEPDWYVMRHNGECIIQIREH